MAQSKQRKPKRDVPHVIIVWSNDGEHMCTLGYNGGKGPIRVYRRGQYDPDSTTPAVARTAPTSVTWGPPWPTSWSTRGSPGPCSWTSATPRL
jgi:hypothetical protein